MSLSGWVTLDPLFTAPSRHPWEMGLHPPRGTERCQARLPTSPRTPGPRSLAGGRALPWGGGVTGIARGVSGPGGDVPVGARQRLRRSLQLRRSHLPAGLGYGIGEKVGRAVLETRRWPGRLS